MTASSETSSNSNGLNRLNQIPGMGVVRRGWLKALGIHTVQDLAKTDVTTLEQQFQAQGYIVSHSDLEVWIEQAIALSNIHSSATPVHLDPSCIDDLDDWAALEAERDEFLQGGCLVCGTGVLQESEEDWDDELESPAEETLWQSVASFEVKFQIRQEGGQSQEQTVIRHQESGYQYVCKGWAENDLQAWMLERGYCG